MSAVAATTAAGSADRRTAGGLGAWWAGWLPLLRIARRDALRARGRSALIIAMIALPVAGMAGTDVLVRSGQLDPTEVAARELGTSQAVVISSAGAGRLEQPPDQRYAGSFGESTPLDPAAQAAAVRALLPAGDRVLTSTSGSVQARTATGVAQVGWTEVNVGAAAFHGKFRRVSGQAPLTATEVAVSAALLHRLGVQVGEDVRLTQPVRTVRVTGVVDQVGHHGEETFWARPGALLDVSGGSGASPPDLYLVGPTAISWATVQEFNKVGAIVLSRAVLLDPPPRSAVPYYKDTGGGGASGLVFYVLMLSVIVTLAVLEVVLLAGAAFAVGARRQARTLGLLAATGGSRRDVRRVVLAGGAVLGAVGAVAGVVLGLLLARLGMVLLTRRLGVDFGHYDLRLMEVAVVVVIGVVTGVLAAVLPARTASRQDPVVALTGRRGQVHTARKVPVIGVLTTVVGVALAALGSVLALGLTTGLNPASSRSSTIAAALIAGGAALAQLGLIITSSAIIGLVGRLGSRLPLPARLAVRDAARHRGRSAPAMAAVLTAVTGSTALLLLVTSIDHHDRAQYVPTWPAMTAGMPLTTYDYNPRTQVSTPHTATPARVLSLVRPHLPAFTPTVVTSTLEGCSGNDCNHGYANPLPSCASCATTDVPISGRLDGTAVGGESLIGLLTDASPTAAAKAVLARGGVVVFRGGLVRQDGTVRFDIVSAADSRAQASVASSGTDAAPPTHQVSVPGIYLPVRQASTGAIYSLAAARTMGLSTHPSTVLMRFARLPTVAQEDAARGALSDAGLGAELDVERGYRSSYRLGLLLLMLGAAVITLGAAGIATGLAQADARADHATLAAVGAAPRLRRTLAAAQALTIALLGTGLGILAGFVPAVALIGAVKSLDLVIPWARLATVLVGVPLLAGVLAFLLTRSRVPLERRIG